MKAIMYHYVRPFDEAFPNLNHLHIDDFSRQLDYFHEEFGFVSQGDFLNSIKTGEKAEGVVLTFDDGLSCHYDHVFPELKKRDLWGVFYIPTQPYAEEKIIDVHRIHLLLGRNDPKNVAAYLESMLEDSFLDKGKMEEFERFTYGRQVNDQYTLRVKRILNYFIAYTHREGILDQLMSRFVPNEHEVLKNFYLTSDQITEMHEAGMIIGSHTVNHPVMSRLSEHEQELQVIQSFDYLKGVVKEFHHKTFCYPYGGFHSFTNYTEKLLKEQGCLYSFNVEQRDIETKDILQRPQALPRYDCNQFKYGQVRKR